MNSRITADERSALLASLGKLPPKHWLKGRNNRLRLEAWHTLNERMQLIATAIRDRDNATLIGRVWRDFYIKVFLIIRDNWVILAKVAEAENHKELPPTPEEAIAAIWQQECQTVWNFAGIFCGDVSATTYKKFYQAEERLLYRIDQGDPEAIAQAQKEIRHLKTNGLVSSELLIWCIGTLMRENKRHRDPALAYSISEYNAAIANIRKAVKTTGRSFANRNGTLLQGKKAGYA